MCMWSYSNFTTYNPLFGGSGQEEIKLTDVLPKLTAADLNGMCIWTGRDETFSAHVQDALFALGCHWSSGGVQFTDEPCLVIQDRRITYCRSSDQSVYAADTRWFFHCQITNASTIHSPITKEQHDTERDPDTGSGTAGGRCLTGPTRTGRIASAERLIPHEVRTKPGKPQIIGHLLRGAILTSGGDRPEEQDQGTGRRTKRWRGSSKGDVPFYLNVVGQRKIGKTAIAESVFDADTDELPF